jgi:hypothetical protein
VQIAITFKNQQVLKDVSWEVKKGERVGLVGERPPFPPLPPVASPNLVLCYLHCIGAGNCACDASPCSKPGPACFFSHIVSCLPMLRRRRSACADFWARQG